MAERGSRCFGCNRHASFAELGSSEKHHDLQCGHVYCELCLTAVQGYTPSLCPACGASTNLSEKQSLYTVKWIDQQRKLSTRKIFEGMTDDCTISNIRLANAGYSQKHPLHCDETDFPRSSQKMNVYDLKSHYNFNSAKKLKRITNCDKLEKPMITESVADSQTQKGAWKNSNVSSMDTNIEELIDEALVVGSLNLEKLNGFLQTLAQLHTQTKQEEMRIEQLMKEDFNKISVALQKRKGMLHTELISHTDNCCEDIENMKKKIEEQHENIKGALQLAKGLKETPSSRAYCDLNQIIGCLKSTVKDDCAVMEDLKLRTCLRFHMNSEEILCTLKHLGKIDFEVKKRCHSVESGDTRQVINDDSYQTESSVWDTYLSVDNMIGTSMKHFETESQIKQDSSAVNAQFKNAKPKEFTSSSLQKSMTTLPEISSTPDVIIEEIIEDDGESCLSGIISDTPKKEIMKQSTCSTLLEQRANDQELVFVRHVVNPCHFYVQRYSKKKTTNELEQNLALYCSTNCAPSPNDILVLGENIFVRSKEHGKWCRAKITELIPMESKNVGKPCGPTKYEVKDISVMQVFFLDFGSSEVLIVLGFGGLAFLTSEHLPLQHSLVNDLCPHIRKIDSLMEAKMRSVLPLAVQCALKDIVPHSDIGWGEDVKDEFLRMVNNKAVLMKVFKEENGKLIVDLKKPRTNKITSDMPVSLRDALVFTELARFRSQIPATASEDETVSSYFPPILPQPMTHVSIVVCHVNSPSDFYIQMIDTLEYLNLENKMKDVYTNEDGDNLEIICPVKGQACVAMFENEWYRAEVISLPGHREVEVKYIDFGNIAKVNVKKLRKVKDEFLSLPQKGIWCKLAHIEPFMKKDEWSTEAIKEFEKTVHDKIMQCTVISILQEDKLSVELFEPDPLPGKITASVNTTLVEDNLASFIAGELSSKYFHEIWDPALEIILSESPYEKSIQCDEDLDFASLKIREELKVRISHVESPSKFFVQWLSSENRLKCLQDKLSDAYNKSNDEKIEWCIDMYCAVEVLLLKQWRRGQVKQVVSETLVKVFYFDYGIQEEVHVSCLRILKDDLNTMGPLALAFSLKDIRPAGGSEKWTATACDVLSHYLTGAVAYLSLEDNCSKWPLPVKMFCKDESGQLVDVSNFLVKQGLALRVRRMEPAQEACESHPDMCMENEASSSNDVLPEAKCASSDFNPEELALSNFSCTVKEPVLSSKGIIEPYKPPCVPTAKTFQAEVSSVGDDGTIYVVQNSLKNQLKTLMENMQNDLKFLGILEPYGWKKGEGCSIRGSDTMWYRGKVMEVVGGSIRVQYVDHGYIEKIPQCHLSPSVLYSDVPQFAIPCELHNILPVGKSWQPDAVELLEEFLLKKCVDIQLVGQSESTEGRIPVILYCDGISLAHFMEQHNHCFTKDYQNRMAVEAVHLNKCDLLNHWENNFEDLLLPEFETPLLPRYILPSLPYPGQLFPVTVKHVETPNEVWICLDSKDCMSHLSDTDDSGLSCDSDMGALELELRSCNQNVEALSSVNDFRSEMPCLAKYSDGQLYRAKFISIQQYNPVSILVQHVDYGSSSSIRTDSIFQIPASLMQYPARALKVKLAGFKPPLEDGETQRIPYRPAWSMEAMYAMLDCVNGKQLYASSVTRSPEPKVFLYEDERYLVHMPLLQKGLAELDE